MVVREKKKERKERKKERKEGKKEEGGRKEIEGGGRKKEKTNVEQKHLQIQQCMPFHAKQREDDGIKKRGLS